MLIVTNKPFVLSDVMLSVTNKPFVLSVIILGVVMLSVVALYLPVLMPGDVAQMQSACLYIPRSRVQAPLPLRNIGREDIT